MGVIRKAFKSAWDLIAVPADKIHYALGMDKLVTRFYTSFLIFSISFDLVDILAKFVPIPCLSSGLDIIGIILGTLFWGRYGVLENIELLFEFIPPIPLPIPIIGPLLGPAVSWVISLIGDLMPALILGARHYKKHRINGDEKSDEVTETETETTKYFDYKEFDMKTNKATKGRKTLFYVISAASVIAAIVTDTIDWGWMGIGIIFAFFCSRSIGPYWILRKEATEDEKREIPIIELEPRKQLMIATISITIILLGIILYFYSKNDALYLKEAWQENPISRLEENLYNPEPESTAVSDTLDGITDTAKNVGKGAAGLIADGLDKININSPTIGGIVDSIKSKANETAGRRICMLGHVVPHGQDICSCGNPVLKTVQPKEKKKEKMVVRKEIEDSLDPETREIVLEQWKDLVISRKGKNAYLDEDNFHDASMKKFYWIKILLVFTIPFGFMSFWLLRERWPARKPFEVKQIEEIEDVIFNAGLEGQPDNRPPRKNKINNQQEDPEKPAGDDNQ